ncbi:MAG TPA: DUF6186 family protein [Actinomycetota bacterium]|nr:DUF6186 family protein [Actinomycetota bacterium]
MSSRAVTLAGYLLIAGTGVVMQLLAWRGHLRIPTFGQLMSRIMRTRAGRVGVMAGWAWLGLHFFAR